MNIADKIRSEGITFDDVLLVPARSDVLPRDADTTTKLTRNITINIPIVSAAMDTVTESRLAIALAQEGGIGIIHKNLTIEEQAKEVSKVKRSENGIIFDPVTLRPEETVGKARETMSKYSVSGIPITIEGGKLVGILTKRDLRFQEDMEEKISEVMTSDRLITAPMNTTLEKARDLLHREKVEKLLLVDDKGRLGGLITIKDINLTEAFPYACRDGRGRLRVGAAVSPNELDRVEKLIECDVDVIVVDTAHGHSRNVVNSISEIKKNFEIELIAGNIATTEAAEDLMKAGADGLKIGIGPGSICTTRVIAGVGVPQITAIMAVTKATKGTEVPVIADGGIRYSGDITKAIAAGANSVMLGNLFAGLEESPGETIIYQGRPFKAYRGMGSTGAMMKGSKARYFQEEVTESRKLVPEGVEGRVPVKGKLSDFIYQVVGGLSAGMGYCGAATIDELRDKGRFIKVSNASQIENHPHDIVITRESSNYWLTQS